MDFNLSQFAFDVRQKRSLLRFDLRTLGNRLSVSATTLSRVENQSIPDLFTYQKLCHWLGKPMGYYFI